MPLKTIRVWISVTENLFKDIKASYTNVDNGVLFLIAVDGTTHRTMGGFVDWQFYEVLDES